MSHEHSGECCRPHNHHLEIQNTHRGIMPAIGGACCRVACSHPEHTILAQDLLIQNMIRQNEWEYDEKGNKRKKKRSPDNRTRYLLDTQFERL